MKKVALVFSSLLFATLLLPGLLQPPAENASADKVRVQGLAHALVTALEEYRAEFGHYPDGGNGQIMQALRGENERSRVFFEAPPELLNEHGELLDPWGTPFRITIDPVKAKPHIHSAGANLIMEEHGGHHFMASDDYRTPP